ncbi:MAG: PrgI family protein [Patescibacteria group bacterium]
MQFKVPQNVDMADKIIGPLTMAQFLYVIIGGLIDYILLQNLIDTAPGVFFSLAIPIALFSLAMAFLKINDIPFPRFIQAAILFMSSPKRRIWHKYSETSPVRITTPKQKIQPKIVRKNIEKSEIEKMAAVLDTAGWAAVRDEQLKSFVKEFDKNHRPINPDKQSVNNQQEKQ